MAIIPTFKEGEFIECVSNVEFVEIFGHRIEHTYPEITIGKKYEVVDDSFLYGGIEKVRIKTDKIVNKYMYFNCNLFTNRSNKIKKFLERD